MTAIPCASTRILETYKQMRKINKESVVFICVVKPQTAVGATRHICDVTFFDRRSLCAPAHRQLSLFGVSLPSQEHVLESSGFPGLQAGPGGTTAYVSTRHIWSTQHHVSWSFSIKRSVCVWFCCSPTAGLTIRYSFDEVFLACLFEAETIQAKQKR